MDRQLRAMRQKGIGEERIFIDRASGKNFNRPRYRALARRLKRGDTLYIHSVDRLGRSYTDIPVEWNRLSRKKGVIIKVLDMKMLDTDRPMGRIGVFLMQVELMLMSFLAEDERLRIRQRQAERWKEKERLQRIQDVLKIGPNDALWSIIVALEYQRSYYEELPKKIRTTTQEILSEWSAAAQKNPAFPQNTNGEKAAEQIKSISIKGLTQPWLIWVMLTLCLLLLYGSLSMWAGYSIGSGQAQPPILLMRMPVGILMGILCLGGCMFEGILAAKAFGDTDSSWRKHAFAATGFLVPGAWSISVALF